MAVEPFFNGAVVEGKLKLFDREGFEKYVATLDGDVKLHVFKQKKTRSNEENRYYWGCILRMIADECGMSAEEVHEALKIKFLPNREAKLFTVRSTSSLSTVQFEAYMEELRRWAAMELNVVIPLPNEAEY